MKQSVILIPVVLLFVSGCVSIKPGYFSDDNRLAEKAVNQFHNQFNSSAFHEIFKSTHPEARATKSEVVLTEVLTGLHSTYGDVRSSVLAASKVAVVSTKERSVEMIYKTQYERGSRNEIFLFISDGAKAQLYSLGIATDDELREAQKSWK